MKTDVHVFSDSVSRVGDNNLLQTRHGRQNSFNYEIRPHPWTGAISRADHCNSNGTYFEADDSEHEVNDDNNYSNTDVHNNDTEETAGIPEITTDELQTAINKLKEGKSPDSKGIRAEDIKA